MYIKICGLRDAEMTRRTVDLGADAIGVVMSPGSPRDTSPEIASSIVSAARAASASVDTVLVVNRMPAAEAASLAAHLGFDVLQLHGSYSAQDFEAAKQHISRVWRATSLAANPDLRAGDFGEERLLVDGTRPGSGEPWDLSALQNAQLGDEWILAGGLDPESVAAAIAQSSPWGVDVSSGVERSPGVKDPARIQRFIREARQASSDTKNNPKETSV
ncbi:phosphoribosylanthranilate isomerase [Leucobacter insecticola]|uniref:N-(5'-phosphoribosyl)anthranilate isomerase n=1 Tax=Leucobacter insecticola TaxID=2714934 RepID=A0A6G8FJH3_9MICO|nr:phosphoribosylanthranilate isomerase [Leucobacter insecticola]QIM16488.1 phosphoribosylanthranilate isomerase [Leucobacter insecticola]